MPPIRGRKANMSTSSSPGKRPNTIGVPERELNDLMDRLDERNAGQGENIQRTYARWPFRQTSLTLTLEHPGGSRASFQVACRNLSRGGTGVLHNSYVHAGTPCVLELPTLDGGREGIRSTIVRCTHMQGVMHELGVKFDKPIHLENFIQLNPLMGWSTFEKVDPETLAGTLLVVTDSDLDERIIGHYLSESRLKIKFVKTAEEATSLGPNTADIALIDLGVEGAESLFSGLRDRQTVLMAVAIGPDTSGETRMTIQDVGADGFLFKPMSNDRLLGVLADCLLGGDSLRIDPKLAGEAGGALVNNCVEQLRGFSKQIREALEADDAMRCYAICQQVKAAAAPIGLQPIIRQADQTAAALAQSMNCKDCSSKLHDLARACERIRLSSAA